MAQALHAFREFIEENSEKEKEWYRNSNHICILSVKDEVELDTLLTKVKRLKLTVSSFKEPDFNSQLTAIVIGPGKTSRKVVSNLPLALKEYL